MDNQSYIPAIRKLILDDRLKPIRYITDTLSGRIYNLDIYNIGQILPIATRSDDIIIIDTLSENDSIFLIDRLIEEDFKGFIIIKNALSLYRQIWEIRYNHRESIFYCTLWDANIGIFRKEFNQYIVPNGIAESEQELADKFCEYMNPINTDTFLFPYKKNRYRYSVLTCMFNRYELCIREPEEVESDVEYVLVTDEPEFASIATAWKVIVIDSFFDNYGGYAKSFYVKYHPFEFVSSDTVLWIDGSVVLGKNITGGIMDPFISSNAELLEMDNIITPIGDWELNRWLEHKFHGFDQAQYDISKEMFKDEPWIHDGNSQTTIYACKNTRLVNMINNRTADMLQRLRCDGDILYLYMPHRAWLINKYLIGSDKVMFLDVYELFGDHFTYCDHDTKKSQEDGWREYGHDINHDPQKEKLTTFWNRKIKLIKHTRHE